jgi:hypothetical protein
MINPTGIGFDNSVDNNQEGACCHKKSSSSNLRRQLQENEAFL